MSFIKIYIFIKMASHTICVQIEDLFYESGCWVRRTNRQLCDVDGQPNHPWESIITRIVKRFKDFKELFQWLLNMLA